MVWLAARLAAEGAISVGQLVAVFGYAAVLVVPVSFLIEGAVDISRALVAGRRVTDFLSLQRNDEVRKAALPTDGDLIDSVSGVAAPAGMFTAIATARQADAVALVDRLGGVRPRALWNGQSIDVVDPTRLR